MKRLGWFLVCGALACLGCGGSGPVGMSGMSGTGLVASFSPDQPNPTALSAALAAGTAQNDTILVRLDVTGVNALRAVSFDLIYDSAAVEFSAWSAGDALETSGFVPLYLVSANTPGVVTVGIDLVGPGSVDIGPTRTLVRLLFRVKRSGSFPLTFQAESLRDVNLQPVGASWHAGTLLAN